MACATRASPVLFIRGDLFCFSFVWQTKEKKYFRKIEIKKPLGCPTAFIIMPADSIVPNPLPVQREVLTRLRPDIWLS